MGRRCAPRWPFSAPPSASPLVAGGSAGAATFLQEWGGLGSGPGPVQKPLRRRDRPVGEHLRGRHRKRPRAEIHRKPAPSFTSGANSGTERREFFAPAGIAVRLQPGYVYVARPGQQQDPEIQRRRRLRRRMGHPGQYDDQPDGTPRGSPSTPPAMSTWPTRAMTASPNSRPTGTFYLQDWGAAEGTSQGQFLGPNGIAIGRRRQRLRRRIPATSACRNSAPTAPPS